MCPCRGARASSQVSQTAARGRNRLAEFTGESLPAPLPLSGHITGFILRPFASHGEPIAEEGMYRQLPKATQAGAAPASTRPGCSLARRWPPLNVDRSLRSLRPHGGCG